MRINLAMNMACIMLTQSRWLLLEPVTSIGDTTQDGLEMDRKRAHIEANRLFILEGSHIKKAIKKTIKKATA